MSIDRQNYIYAYHQAIQNGEITVGRYVRKLYEIIVTGIENGTYTFDASKVGRAIDFIETFCHHNKGALAPGRIKLELYQKALVSVIFGIVREDGMRQFNEVFCVLGRKCGKTLLAAAIMVYLAYADGEYGAEIYAMATKRDQADLVYSAFKFNIDHEPALRRRAKNRKNDIYIEKSNTTIVKLGFNDRTSDGFNMHGGVGDELAAWVPARGLKMWEVMMSGRGARRQPLMLGISSGGYVSEGIYDELRRRGTQFLAGTSREERFLSVMYEIDDPEKWDDIEELKKSLPGLGVSVSESYIRDEINTALMSLSKKTEFLTKYCNLKQNSSAAWLNIETIKKSFPPNHLSLEDFRHCYALGGIDLSKTTDLTAATLLIERDGIIYYFARFFLPRAKIEEATARDGVPYEAYIQRGFLMASGDNVVDYKDMYNWFVDLVEEYEIYPLKIGYDRYSAQYLVQELQAYGFQLDSVVQGSNLTGVIFDTEGMLMDGNLQCAEDNDLMKLHLMDSALKIEDETDRRRLIKIKKNSHVDGTAALLDAMCMRRVYWEELKDQLKNERRGDDDGDDAEDLETV